VVAFFVLLQGSVCIRLSRNLLIHWLFTHIYTCVWDRCSCTSGSMVCCARDAKIQLRLLIELWPWPVSCSTLTWLILSF